MIKGPISAGIGLGNCAEKSKKKDNNYIRSTGIQNKKQKYSK